MAIVFIATTTISRPLRLRKGTQLKKNRSVGTELLDHYSIHMEGFAQVLIKYPHEKYHSANYEQVGKIIYQYTGNELANAQQLAKRLLVNILLANGDAYPYE